MNMLQFTNSVFEIADMWVDSIDESEYYSFLHAILQARTCARSRSQEEVCVRACVRVCVCLCVCVCVSGAGGGMDQARTVACYSMPTSAHVARGAAQLGGFCMLPSSWFVSSARFPQAITTKSGKAFKIDKEIRCTQMFNSLNPDVEEDDDDTTDHNLSRMSKVPFAMSSRLRASLAMCPCSLTLCAACPLERTRFHWPPSHTPRPLLPLRAHCLSACLICLLAVLLCSALFCLTASQ